MKVLKTWESWSLYSTSFLSQLRAVFLDIPYESSPEQTRSPSPDVNESSPEPNSPTYSQESEEALHEDFGMEDLDGSPLVDSYDSNPSTQNMHSKEFGHSSNVIEYDKELDGYPLDENGEPIFTDDEDDLFE